jgi:RHS repeat-associated protein
VIWDGSQELGEIQMPGADGANLENDTQISFQQTLVSQSPTDANHFYGIVAYTFGTALDRPLSAMRMNYSDGLTGSAWYAFHSAFDVIPLWNDRGQMDGAFYNYGASSYSEQASPNDIRRDSLDVPADWYAYARSQYVPSGWHGTLLSDKADNSGMLYRRNRYYDPSTGRFTQEDPIGLAGGLNVYGFAGGDPVNFSDPFGLCPPKDNTPCPAQQIDNSDGLGWARFAGAMLKPAQPILEAAANAEMAFMPLGELGEAANITKLGLREGKVEEGIYEFTATSEKVYVGQSGNISQRLLQHVRSGKLAASDVTSVSRTEVLGGKTAREIAEQRRINQLGGIVNLENKVNPIGPARLHLLNNP